MPMSWFRKWRSVWVQRLLDLLLMAAGGQTTGQATSIRFAGSNIQIPLGIRDLNAFLPEQPPDFV